MELADRNRSLTSIDLCFIVKCRARRKQDSLSQLPADGPRCFGARCLDMVLWRHVPDVLSSLSLWFVVNPSCLSVMNVLCLMPNQSARQSVSRPVVLVDRRGRVASGREEMVGAISVRGRPRRPSMISNNTFLPSCFPACLPAWPTFSSTATTT